MRADASFSSALPAILDCLDRAGFLCHRIFSQVTNSLLIQKRRKNGYLCYTNCGSSRHTLHRGTTSSFLSFSLNEPLLLANRRVVRLGHSELNLLPYHPEQQQLLASLGCTCSSSFFPTQDASLCFSFLLLTLCSQLGHQLLPTYSSPVALLPFFSHSRLCQLLHISIRFGSSRATSATGEGGCHLSKQYVKGSDICNSSFPTA